MVEQYALDLPEAYVQLMEKWHLDDPVDAVERHRHSIIAEEMGRDNPYVVNK